MLTDTSPLLELGWSPRWEALFASHDSSDLVPGRVIRSDRGSSLIAVTDGVIRAKPSTRMLKTTEGTADLPVAGDWIGARASEDLDVALIDIVLDRSSAITRNDPGNTSATQVLAANVDTVFVVHPIADSPNLRRIERELSLAWDSGAVPVVVLTKADLSPDPAASLAEVQSIAFGVDVVTVNALDGDSAGQLLPYFSDHRTAVLLGPSGAGKSTLTNALIGEQRQATREVRVFDGRGRHTTVARELVTLAGHGVLIDTPGLRALGLAGSEEGLASAFPDIEELAVSCRFRDCTHRDEPGCAVRLAAESGTLPPERLESYHKLGREAQVAAMKTDARLRAEETRKWKIIMKSAKHHQKRKGWG